jgi:hypothetical protein
VNTTLVKLFNKKQMKAREILIDALFLALVAAVLSALTLYIVKTENRKLPAKYDSPIMQAFFPQGKPIGQPLSRLHTDIRMVRVDSYREAYDFFLSACGSEAHVFRFEQLPYLYCKCTLRDMDDILIFTDRATPNTYETAILYILSDSIKRNGIGEIRFVETVKKQPEPAVRKQNPSPGNRN